MLSVLQGFTPTRSARFVLSQVPEMWEKKGFLSLRPLSSWMNDLIARVQSRAAEFFSIRSSFISHLR